VYACSRTVRATDVTPAGRLRLDAFARYLQEAAEDDVADSGWEAPATVLSHEAVGAALPPEPSPAPYDWLLRRCAVTADGYPVRGDRVTLCTSCTGTGPRWAERTTTLAGPDGDLMQATAVWVAIGRDGQPAELGPGFHRRYGQAAGRRVSARLTLRPPAASAAARPWPLRASDFDLAGHVNNAVHWAAAEDVLAGLGWVPGVAELEYHRPILPGDAPRLLTDAAADQVLFWLVDGDRRLASGRLARPGPAASPPASD
jgi:acyl-ACP thioesterase